MILLTRRLFVVWRMSRTRAFRFVLRHSWVRRLVPSAVLSRLIWGELQRDTDFMEGIRQGREDADAGRCYTFEGDGSGVPCESWRADDPIQPDGFHHDGTRWVRNNDGGWFVDRDGYWRYNKPGDPGWLELPDGSWKYVSAMVQERPGLWVRHSTDPTSR